MENYIFRRIQTSKELIARKIHSEFNFSRPDKINYIDLYNFCLKPMRIKTMPQKHVETVAAIFDFYYKEKISNNILHPRIFEGRLYSKWQYYPSELQRQCKDNNFKTQYTVVFNKDFTEGMQAHDRVVFND